MEGKMLVNKVIVLYSNSVITGYILIYVLGIDIIVQYNIWVVDSL